MSAIKRGIPSTDAADGPETEPESHVRCTTIDDESELEEQPMPANLVALVAELDAGRVSPTEAVEQLIEAQLVKARAVWSADECADFEASMRAVIEGDPHLRQLLGLPPIPPSIP